MQCTKYQCVAVQCNVGPNCLCSLHFTISCNTVQCNEVCNVVQSRSMQCAVQYSDVSCSVQCSALQCGAVQCITVMCDIVCSAVQCGVVCSAVQSSVVQCSAVQCAGSYLHTAGSGGALMKPFSGCSAGPLNYKHCSYSYL